ncbi:putative conjugative transfer protein TraN [Orientia tsutsugamushi str. Gilliam]|uniref:Putative conjugative transfer protein TraN n=1 Tax=Orientia tsutsugamushi str. Gilliam TaxID=1359184 RepID=A0A0F3M521_ORITS|nr:putative conjugative transfer protein TraN [Orientia tsutsugamushi str. Gilliam]
MNELFGDILTKAQNSMNKDIIAGIKDKFIVCNKVSLNEQITNGYDIN